MRPGRFNCRSATSGTCSLAGDTALVVFRHAGTFIEHLICLEVPSRAVVSCSPAHRRPPGIKQVTFPHREAGAHTLGSEQSRQHGLKSGWKRGAPSVREPAVFQTGAGKDPFVLAPLGAHMQGQGARTPLVSRPRHREGRGFAGVSPVVLSCQEARWPPPAVVPGACPRLCHSKVTDRRNLR